MEDEIIEKLSATRHAVRRAFDELERLGLAKRLPNKGVHVRDYSVSEIEELYELRECLEVKAASRFVRGVSGSVIKELTDLADAHRDASRQLRFSEVFVLNNQFHEAMYRAAGNRTLADAILYYTFSTHPIRSRAFADEELREHAIKDHYDIIAAISVADTAKIIRLVKLHINRPKDFYLQTMKFS